MFKWLTEWFTDFFPKSEDTAETLINTFKGINEDVSDFLEDIQKAIDNTKKQFLVEVTVGPDTKMRPLKAAMEVALIDALSKSNPECSDWTVKSYYHR